MRGGLQPILTHTERELICLCMRIDDEGGGDGDGCTVNANVSAHCVMQMADTF